MTFTAQHIDTCIGCYLQDHHNRDGELLLGAYVDGLTTYAQVLEELISELQSRAIDDEAFNYDSAKAAIKSLFSEVGVSTLGHKLFDASLEINNPDEIDELEPCQAWFLLTWDVPDNNEEEVT